MNIDPVVLFGAAVWFAAWTATLAVIILRTKKVSTDVIASAGRIEGNAETHFKRMETALNDKIDSLDLSSIEKQVESLQPLLLQFKELEDNIPDFDLQPLLAEFQALKTELPDTISKHIDMHMLSMKASEGKAIAAMVEDLNIEGLTEEAKEEAVGRLSTKQRLAYQLMTMKVPGSTKKAHPASAFVFENARGLAAQMLIESDDQQRGTVSYEGGNSGGVHRPGLRR